MSHGIAAISRGRARITQRRCGERQEIGERRRGERREPRRFGRGATPLSRRPARARERPRAIAPSTARRKARRPSLSLERFTRPGARRSGGSSSRRAPGSACPSSSLCSLVLDDSTPSTWTAPPLTRRIALAARLRRARRARAPCRSRRVARRRRRRSRRCARAGRPRRRSCRRASAASAASAEWKRVTISCAKSSLTAMTLLRSGCDVGLERARSPRSIRGREQLEVAPDDLRRRRA